jgi:hypothetical protein
MDKFSREDLEEALPVIASMISRSEAVKYKFKEGTPQASLTRNRLKALNISSALITKELNSDFLIDDFSEDDLEKALLPITSTIRKCEKALKKLKEGTPQASLTRNMLLALNLSLALITKELNEG